VVGLSVSRRTTFVILLVPAIALFLLADVPQAVTLASRVFAAYFVLQATIAWIIARRKGNWGAVAGFTGIGAMMATIAIFGLPL
jgi:VIT1/CCC1 family predicted Fe2+/Mn2+ transporter